MNDIDYNAVIEIINDFLNNEKVEIYGISYGEEFRLRQAIENLLKERQADKDRIKELEDRNEKLYEDNLTLAQELMEIRVSSTAHGMIEDLRKENKELKDRIREINDINFPINY